MTRPWDLLTEHERADRVREHLAVAHAACERCGYDLFGITGSECPECGAAVDQGRFSFLVANPSDAYRANRLAEHVRKYKSTCPHCQSALDALNGCACARCGAHLDVWDLTPCGLRGDRRMRVKWAIIIAAIYVTLAALGGALILMIARSTP